MALNAVLDDVHRAGVLHRDIRSWNLMLDDDDAVHIIDFDRASLDATPEDFDAEKARLKSFIEGQFVDLEPAIGRDCVTEWRI